MSVTQIAADDAPPALLEARAITKRFPGVLALSEVSIMVRQGEIHALVGENGAGKSTLMKILSGVYAADSGEIIFKGQPTRFANTRQAQKAGIATIYQELNQVPQLSVTENIFLGSELTRGIALDWPAMHQQARALLARLHLDIDPRMPLHQLGVGHQQMVEVAKALHQRADLIIMDEPTSALTTREIDYLFTIARQLRANGVSVIYISHHLDEIFGLCDRVTVLRDGRYIATSPVAELKIDRLIRLIVGRDLSEQLPKEQIERGREILRVEELNRGKTLRDISFSIHAGEVLGIAGLVGAGRTELARAIFGADPIDSGRIFVDGRQVSIRSPRDAIRHGIALLTEDRKQQGLFLQLPLRENITMAVLERLTPGPVTDRRKEIALARHFIDRMAIKAPSQRQLVMNLSGGTQQKVVLGKWMATEPRVLIFDEPTRGIDVGAKVEIYKMINQLARQGIAIIMVSSELLEILGMSDRILVMWNGQVGGVLNRAEATEEKIMAYATGSDQQATSDSVSEGPPL